MSTRRVVLVLVLDTDAKLEDLQRVTYLEFGDMNNARGFAEPVTSAEARCDDEAIPLDEHPAIISTTTAMEI